LPSEARSSSAKSDSLNLSVNAFHASVLLYGSDLLEADLQAGSWDGATLEDNRFKWHGDHIFPLPKFNLHDAQATRAVHASLQPDSLDPRR